VAGNAGFVIGIRGFSNGVLYCRSAPRGGNGHLSDGKRRAIHRSWWWVVADVVAGVLAVGALDLLVDAF
jgi:hypothetical protein